MGRSKKLINNAFYDDLHDQWNLSMDHPIALLRSENQLRNPWIQDLLESHFSSPCNLLDIGCGAGLLSNFLAEKGHTVTGIDLSENSLKIAQKNDASTSVCYKKASALDLPFQNESFEAVCAMDVLEHVEDPLQLVKEASRVLKPGGLFIFYTFNRTVLSYLLVIKGVEWLVPNTPKNMHVFDLFISPQEMRIFCEKNNLSCQEFIGIKPKFSKDFFLSALTRKVRKNFSFRFTPSLSMGYCGVAIKTGAVAQ